MRVPVVESRGTLLLLCAPARTRHLFARGKARPEWNTSGLFAVHVTDEQEPDNQPLVVGVDAGSRSKSLSVVGSIDTVLHLMTEASSTM